MLDGPRVRRRVGCLQHTHYGRPGGPLLEAEVRRAEATDAKRIVIDLSAVTFMDSSGLKSLLQAQARSQADSNRLRLVRPPRRVQRVFELTNTEGLLPFLD